MKFTKSNIDKLALPKPGERVLLWDSDLPGFGLRVTPSGKMYIAQSRVDGVTRRISLGKHGILTPDEARKKAQRELAKMRDGKDPVIEKRRVKAFSLTLQEIAEKYLEDRRDLKASSRADIEKHLKKSFADWANRPATEITRDKVLTRFRELTDKGPTQANQAFRNLRALLNYARATYRPGDKPILIENPVQVLSDAKLWNKVKAKSGRIPTDKIGATWNMIQKERGAPEQTSISRTVADIVLFLLLTGCRWSEASGLTWEQVNLDESWWYLPDPKNRTPVKFPLSHVAREILKARPQDSIYVFSSRYDLKKPINTARSLLLKISKVIETPISAHDLRRTFRAIAAECNIELWRTKLLMNHKLSGDVTIAAYTEKEDLRYLSTEINQIADWVLSQGFIAGSANIVQMPTKRVK